MAEPVSKNNDGWCGEPCPGCNGTGEVDTAHSYATCGRCGGTGERYESALDLREPADPIDDELAAQRLADQP